MKTVFISGTTGFVGEYLSRLLSQTYSVIGLSRNGKANDSQAAHMYKGDITDIKVLHRILKEHKPEYIVHLAANTISWFTDPFALFQTNVLGTINLYESILKIQKIHPYNPKIIYAGSSESYGNTPTAPRVKEDAAFFPLNHYGASKASADHISYSYAKSKQLNITIARPFTHTGPGQKQGFFVPDMASQIARLNPEKLSQHTIKVGNLNAIRDYLDVRDVVAAYKLLLEHDSTPGETYNICSGNGIKVADILNKLILASGFNIKLEQDPSKIRPSEVPVLVGDPSKLMKATGWSPKIPLDVTISETLNYWRSR